VRKRDRIVLQKLTQVVAGFRLYESGTFLFHFLNLGLSDKYSYSESEIY